MFGVATKRWVVQQVKAMMDGNHIHVHVYSKKNAA
jgi:hypothetical protein